MMEAMFIYLATVCVVCAVLTVTLRQPVYNVLSLLTLFFHVAGLYVLLNAEFLAVVQIIVYAGAILVLYLFVLMLLNVRTQSRHLHRQWPFAVLILGAVGAMLVGALHSGVWGSASGESTAAAIHEIGDTQAIGLRLYTDYLLPFEVASLVLLVAMIGAIVLTKKSLIDDHIDQIKE
ncbi:MAG: NADH-quinone oxidoreductase subunit J [Nitrospirota bacterium]|nr:NADH-quinone oxidoreductase subunit J [Nitrospirota bacterium]